MNDSEKNKIAEELRQRKSETGMSDPQLANQIGGVGATSVNHILKGRYATKSQLVSDEVFRKVASWLGVDDDWVIVKSDFNFAKVQAICHDAKNDSDSFAIAAPPGYCKSEAAKDYATKRNVYYVKCSQHFTRKIFLAKIMQAMGLPIAIMSVNDMVDVIVSELNKKHKPLLIIDEADKLGDNIFQFFITFYNETYMNCGYVFLGSIFFHNRVLKGVNKNRQGYAEFFSRVGRQFVELDPLDRQRVAVICRENGIKDVEHINSVWNGAENDLRRVKRLVEDIKKTQRIIANRPKSVSQKLALA